MRDTLKRLGLLAIIAGSFFVGNWAFHGAQRNRNASAADSLVSDIYLFNEIMVKLNRHYVDEISSSEMVRLAIDGAMQELDPHTRYFSDDEFNRFQDDTAGSFGGIGVTIQSINDTITVMSVTSGSPAWRAGVLAGDMLVGVDGESIVGFTSDEAVQLMRGETGTHMEVSIVHPGASTPETYDFFRDDVTIDSIPYAFVLDDGVGYIRLQEFNANASTELFAAMETFYSEDVRALIIDLRSNPGGLLGEAIDTLGEFIGPDKLVVSTRGRLPGYNQDYLTRMHGHEPEWPLVVLINETSASAAEIFAGAMQDYDRALIMGETSFGKGSVQQLFPLSQGGIKLTTSYYYIPSGRCIHKSANDDLLRGRVVDDSTSVCADTTMYYTQGGRVVQGGGGVSPDIDSPSVLLSPTARRLRGDNVFFHYVTRELQQNAANPPVELSDAQEDEFFSTRVQGYYSSLEDFANDRAWILTELRASWLDVSSSLGDGQRVRVEADPLVSQARELLSQAATQEQLFAAAGVPQNVARLSNKPR